MSFFRRIGKKMHKMGWASPLPVPPLLRLIPEWNPHAQNPPSMRDETLSLRHPGIILLWMCKFRLINATCTEWLHHRDGRNAPAWRRNCSTITARLLQPLFMSHHLFCTYNYAFNRVQDMTMFPNAAQQSLWIIGLWFKLQLKTELAASHPFGKLKR